jgi:hypothetical protein
MGSWFMMTERGANVPMLRLIRLGISKKDFNKKISSVS